MASAAAKPLRTCEVMKQGTGNLVVNWKDREMYLKKGYKFVNEADAREHGIAEEQRKAADEAEAAVQPIPGDPITDPNAGAPDPDASGEDEPDGDES